MIKYVLFKYILGGKQASREIWQCGFKYFFTLFITYTEWVSNGTLPGYDKLMFWVRILLVLSFSNHISVTLFECIICVWVFFPNILSAFWAMVYQFRIRFGFRRPYFQIKKCSPFCFLTSLHVNNGYIHRRRIGGAF